MGQLEVQLEQSLWAGVTAGIFEDEQKDWDEITG